VQHLEQPKGVYRMFMRNASERLQVLALVAAECDNGRIASARVLSDLAP